MKKKVKIMGGIALLVLTMIFGLVYWLTPLEVETETVVKSKATVSFIEAGEVVNQAQTYVYPLVPGEVVDILVNYGDFVDKGQVLASLDASALNYQIQQLEEQVKGYEAQCAQAKAEYNLSQVRLEANRKQVYGQLQALEAEQGGQGQDDLQAMLVEESKALYDKGKEDLEKYQILYDQGIISENNLKEMENLLKSYASNYQKSLVEEGSSEDYFQGMKTSLYAQIESIDASLDQDLLSSNIDYFDAMIASLEANLEGLRAEKEKHTIKAPQAGIVDDIFIGQTNYVTGMEPAFLIEGEGDKQVQVKVNIRDLNALALGDEVALVLDQRSGDVSLKGKIVTIAESASLEVSPLGIEERKVLVTIQPEENDLLKTGYGVDVEFYVYQSLNEIVVANSALYQKGEADYVMVIEDGKTKEVKVTLGYELVGETVVESGLAEGDELVVDLDAKGLRLGMNAKSSSH